MLPTVAADWLNTTAFGLFEATSRAGNWKTPPLCASLGISIMALFAMHFLHPRTVPVLIIVTSKGCGREMDTCGIADAGHGCGIRRPNSAAQGCENKDTWDCRSVKLPKWDIMIKSDEQHLLTTARHIISGSSTAIPGTSALACTGWSKYWSS